MSFSKEWEERYQANTHLSVWPWSDLVSYIMRYARPTGSEFRVLELGCGAGANIPFFKKLGVQYYSIEGSSSIVNKLWRIYPEYKNNIIVGDFTQDIPFKEEFDLVVDRGSLTHNSTSAIKSSLKLVHNKLNPNGKYIGIDWFSTMHSDYQRGLSCEDNYTRCNITEGHLAHTGIVHFSDKTHLEELFSTFIIEVLEHKVIKREIPEDKFVFASWNLVASKR